jgi:CubicO group peptidase (beta-lactamase class C family)
LLRASALLVGEGKLKWTTPIKDILPEFHNVDPTVGNLTTVVDILAHRMGLSGEYQLTFQGDGDALLPADQLFPTIGQMTPIEPFRNKWIYNSWGYSLASAAIERLSWSTLNDYLYSTLFKPLGMTHTTTQPSFEKGGNIAKPYSSLKDMTPVHLKHHMVFIDTFFEGAGGAYTNLNDMVIWAQEFLRLAISEIDPSGLSPLKEISNILTGHIPIVSRLSGRDLTLWVGYAPSYLAL